MYKFNNSNLDKNNKNYKVKSNDNNNKESKINFKDLIKINKTKYKVLNYGYYTMAGQENGL